MGDEVEGGVEVKVLGAQPATRLAPTSPGRSLQGPVERQTALGNRADELAERAGVLDQGPGLLLGSVSPEHLKGVFSELCARSCTNRELAAPSVVIS